MTANHADGCPARVSTRYGCSCLLRQTSSTGPVSSYPPPRVLPTSRGPGEDAYLKGHDHDAVGNTTGWFDSRDVWHDGHAVTHTESTTDAGPNYCRECSEARGHWVRWPCPATSERRQQ